VWTALEGEYSAFFELSWCISRGAFDRGKWKTVGTEMLPLLSTSWAAFLVVQTVLLRTPGAECFKENKVEFISILEAVDWESVMSFSSNIVNIVSNLLEVATMIV